MIYVYAITEPPAPELGAVTGLSGAAVVAHEHAGLVVLHGSLEAPPGAEHERLWEHERVVEAAMAQRATLPVRFGMTLADLLELEVLLDREAGRFRDLLDRVRGCVELSVRARRDDERLQEPLVALARDSTTRETPAGIASAYLVPADAVQAFAARVGELQDDLGELDLSCTGPWPPYSFVGG